MPVIFTATFGINVNKDRTIDILKKLKEEVKKCGCVDLAKSSKTLDVSLEQAQTAAKQLAGDGEIACEGDVCCVDNERLDSFMDSLNSLRLGSESEENKA